MTLLPCVISLIRSAFSSNGLINIYDIRNLSEPTSSTLVHPSGLSSASFQAHSGLTSIVSGFESFGPGASSPHAKLGLYRSTGSVLSSVTEEDIAFDVQAEDVITNEYRPSTVVHPLRPFLAFGYGRSWFLRGAGVGKGDDTDSGSYSFLKAQAKFIT